MKLFSLFKTAPYIAEVADESEVKKNYGYWRLRIFLGMYLGYIFYYFTRKSYSYVMPILMQDLGFSKSELGFLGTMLSLSYGTSKFLSGILSDRCNPRYFMAVGLILTGIFNILFGCSSTLIFFAICWGLNGWFQGWGWPPCARLLTHWYSQKERGRWWGVWNTSQSVGGGLIPLAVAYCAQEWGWRYAMYIPGSFCILMGFYLMYCLRDTPQSLGLPPIEKFKNDYPVKTKEVEKELSLKEVLFKHVFTNRYIWILGIAYFCVYIIRTAMNDWSVLYLVETRHCSLMAAGACVFSFEAGGVCGSLASGWISDRIFGGRRCPIITIFSFAMLFPLLGICLSPASTLLFVHFTFFVIGFFVFGPQMLVGMAAAELSNKKAAGSATGFVGFIAYLGSGVAGYPLGRITQIFGWTGFFIALIICSAVVFLVLIPLWSVRGHKVEEEKAPALASSSSDEAEPVLED